MRLRESKKRTATLGALALALAGCAGEQSALDTAGPEAAALARLTWVLAACAAAIVALVMGAAWYAVYRDPDRRLSMPPRALIIGGGVAFPIVTLTALLLYSVWLTGELRASDQGALAVQVTGHMWWWEVHYPGTRGAHAVVTANEVRIPTGRRVELSFESADVVHSFWVPSLAGKIDLIPGRRTRMSLLAERPGVFRGQCAEFCGAQHALMAFHVVALAPEEFERWRAAQAAPAHRATNETATEGEKLFLAHGCGNCHTVRGLSEGRVPAPDLTHLASRSWLGAGTLANTRAQRMRWIARGETVKPGRAMPSFGDLDEASLAALADFLGALE